MGRSYLFTGRDTEHLSPAERQLEKLYDQIDRPGYRLSPTQFFQLPQAAELMDQLYGGLTDRIPPGSQIVSQTPGKVTYKDPQGYEHTITRKPDGQFTEATNRPSILPSETSQGQQSTIEALRKRVEQGYTQPPQFASLPPEVQAQLAAIDAAERGGIAKSVEDERGKLIAALYGNNVNKSSIANEAGARFAEGAGRLQQEQAAGAAARTLGLQQFLTNLLQQQGEGAASLYANLSGQANQRDIAGAGLDIDLKRLTESTRQFDLTNYLDKLRTQIEQEQLDTSRGPLAKVLGISQIAKNFAQAAGGGLSAYGALTGGK